MDSNLLNVMGAKGAISQTTFVAAQESTFWVRARRNRLLAEWFSDLTDTSGESYLKLLLDEDFARRESAAALHWIAIKMKNDLLGYGISLSLAEIENVCARCEVQALIDLEKHDHPELS